MRRLWILAWLLAAALAQGLVLPESAQVGRPVEISAEGLEPGAYPVEIEGPDGVQVVTLVTTENGGILPWKPALPGRYRLTLYAPGARYTAELEVAPPPPRVALEPEGLRVGNRLLPLPAGDWLAPLEEPDAVYLGLRGAPLVLRLPYEPPLDPVTYYPPAPVEALTSGPKATLTDGRTLALEALGPESGPYTGPMEALAPLRALDAFWRERGVRDRLPADPDGYRPYWVYWALPAEGLSTEDLTAWGGDLLRRGHRVELAWSEEARVWTDAWQRAARDGRAEALEPARSLALALLDYAPLHPDAQDFFLEQADWLDAQGRTADARRLREASAQARAFVPALRGEGLRLAFYALALAYLALILVLLVRYLPAQRRDLASWGGLLGSWSANPIRRMTRLLLAYAGWGERLLATLLFVALLGIVLLWGSITAFERAQAQAPLGRATLAGAETVLESWPAGPGREALVAYARVSARPAGAGPLVRTPGWLAFAEALRYRLTGDETALERAYRLEAGYVPALERLGLAADAWTGIYRQAGVDRLGVPRARDLCRVYLAGVLARLPERPVAPLEALGVPSGGWAWALLVLLGLWAVLHFWVLLLPRPRGTTRAAGVVVRAVELLLPGSNSLGKGWGVVLLLAAAYGAVRWVMGDPSAGALWLAAAYLPHLVLWYGEVHR